MQNCAKSVHFHPISRNGRIQPRHEIATRLKPHNVQFCSNSTVDQGCNPVLDHTLCTSTQNTSYLDHYWISVHFHTEYTVDQGCNCTLDRTLCASTQNACLTKVAIPLSITTKMSVHFHTDYTVDQGCKYTLDRTLCASGCFFAHNHTFTDLGHQLQSRFRWVRLLSNYTLHTLWK